MVIVEIGRARHHGVERHRHAAGAAAARGADHAAASDVGALLLTVRRLAIFAHPAARLPLLPLGRRRAARRHRPAVLRRHRAARAGLLRRPDLAARHRARRDRRHDRRHPGLGLYAAAAELRRRRHRRPAHPRRRPVGHRRAAAAGAVRPRPAAAGARRGLEPCRSTSSPMSASRCARAPTSIERLQADVFVPSRSRADDAELPAVALVGDGRGTDRDGRPLSRRGAHPHRRSRASPRTRRISLEPKDEADFQLLRYAEHLLASAIGAASSRLVLSLLLRKRTVSTKAALKLLDDANAAIHYNREILQTALDHVRQGIAVFDKDLQLICWNRQFGEILDLPPELTRVGIGARRDPALQRRAAARSARARSTTWCASGSTRYVVRQRAVPRALPRARPGRRGARQPHAGRRHRHHLSPTSRRASKRPKRWSAPTKRWSAACASAPTELTRLNAELGRAKAEAEEANISKTRFLAAASHDILQPLNAARLYVTSLVERQGGGEDAPAGRQRRCLARSGRGNPRRAARHLAARHRRDAAGTRQLPHRRTAAPARGRIRAARRARRGSSSPSCPARSRCAPTGGCCAGCCRTSSPTPSNTRRRAACWSAAGARGGNLRIDVYDTGLGIPASQAARRSSANSTGSTRAPRWRAGSGSACRSSSASRACSITRSRSAFGARPRLALLGRGAAVAAPSPVEQPARDGIARRPRPARSASTVLCIDNEPKVLDGMEALLGGWGCHVLKAPDLDGALAAVDDSEQRAGRAAGRLSSRRRQRHRGDRRAAPAVRRRPAGDPDHRRPLAGGARRGARARHPGAEQAAQAGGAARAVAQWRVQRVAAAE